MALWKGKTMETVTTSMIDKGYEREREHRESLGHWNHSAWHHNTGCMSLYICLTHRM
jgi:hypothetical protein